MELKEYKLGTKFPGIIGELIRDEEAEMRMVIAQQ
jgi:hypothetical protein